MGSVPDFAWGAHSAPQAPKLNFRGPTFKRRERMKAEEKGREGKDENGKKREGENR